MKQVATVLIFATLFALLFVVQSQKAPTIPSAFSTTWSLSVSPFLEGTEIIGGTLVVNYPKNQTYAELQDPGTTPYQFQTTVIGHPINQSYIQGYSFLNVGRCWTIQEPLDSSQFHYFPLHIPTDAVLLGNITNRKSGLWNWKYTVYDFIPTTVYMEIRWSDGAVLRFDIDSSAFLDIQISWVASSFYVTTPPDSLFAKPPGPCPPPPSPYGPSQVIAPEASGVSQIMKAVLSVPDTGAYGSVENTVPFKLAKYYAGQNLKKLASSVLAPKHRVFSLIKSTLQTESKAKKVATTAAPSPPKIKPYFSANYQIGYGTLNKTNNYQGANVQVGFVAVDSVSHGGFVNVRDDASQNVPWELNVNFIGSPISESITSDDYVYLSYGRCWFLGALDTVGQIPFNIPEDAKLIGTDTVDGKLANFWGFVGSVEGIYGNVTIATAVEKGNETSVDVIFAQVADGSYSSYLKFSAFSDNKPNPAIFDKPLGPCIPLFSESSL